MHSDKHAFRHIWGHTLYSCMRIIMNAHTRIPFTHLCSMHTSTRTHASSYTQKHTYTHRSSDIQKLALIQKVQTPHSSLLQRLAPHPHNLQLCFLQPVPSGLQGLRVGCFLARLRWPPAPVGRQEKHRSRRGQEQLNCSPL